MRRPSSLPAPLPENEQVKQIQWSHVTVLWRNSYEPQGPEAVAQNRKMNGLQENRRNKNLFIGDWQEHALFVFLMGFLQCTCLWNTAVVLLISPLLSQLWKQLHFLCGLEALAFSEALINIWLDRLWGGGADDFTDSVHSRQHRRQQMHLKYKHAER